VEASGTPQARTISTQWHPTYRLPVAIAEPLRLTTFNYDASGNLLNKTVQATTDSNGNQGFNAPVTGSPRTWSYTYNQYGQVLTAKGPRTDVNDTTSYAYDSSSGNLLTITNAAGQVTSLSNYDLNGRVGTITDPNGLTTNLSYSPRGWLLSKSVTAPGTGSQLTSYQYDGVGQLISVNLPDNSTITYTYDPAHRLTNIADSLGNSIAYTLDAMGNRVSEQTKDPTGTLSRQVTRIYDALNRLQQVTGAVQ
jgi:YD repeat-containing protein